MIKKITLKNFQAHKETSINFCNGVNTIIGSSDMGKSSIMRAFYWLFYGKPLGDDYASHWIMDQDKLKDEYSVSIETEKGIVSRIKGKNKNVYLLNDKEFSAFGKGNVPEDVIDFLNISDINFQGQHDNSFLLSESSGEVSRVLNRYVRMDIIDTSLSNINSKYRKVKSKKELKEEELEQTQNELLTYSYIEQMEKDINTLKEYNSEIDIISNICSNISEGINNIEEIKEKFIKYNKLIKAEKEYSILADLLVKTDITINDVNFIEINTKEYNEIIENNEQFKKCISCSSEVNNLFKVKDNIDKINTICFELEQDIKIINDYKEKVEKYSTIANISLSKLDRIYNRCKEIEENIEIITTSINEYESITDNIQNKRDEIVEKEKEYNSIFPDICPLCGNNCKEHK